MIGSLNELTFFPNSVCAFFQLNVKRVLHARRLVTRPGNEDAKESACGKKQKMNHAEEEEVSLSFAQIDNYINVVVFCLLYSICTLYINLMSATKSRNVTSQFESIAANDFLTHSQLFLIFVFCFLFLIFDKCK